MEYMLAFMESADDFASRDDKVRMAGWMDYIGAMAQAGLMRGGNGLMGPETGTRVLIRDGRRLVQDGPIADSKEQLGGYVIIDAPDLDTALAWAAKAPCATTGHVEVRPVMPPMAK